MAFIASNRFQRAPVPTDDENELFADGPTTVMDIGSTYKLNSFRNKRQLPQNEDRGDYLTSQQIYEQFTGGITQTDDGLFYGNVPQTHAVADGYVYVGEPGWNISTLKTQGDAGQVFADSPYRTSSGPGLIAERGNQNQLVSSGDMNGNVLAAGCGLVAVGNYRDISDSDGIYGVKSSFVQIWSAGLQHKLFGIYADDKHFMNYDGSRVAGPHITSCDIGDGRIVVGYAYHDIDRKNFEGDRETPEGYVEVYDFSGRLLTTILAPSAGGGFGFDVSVDSGYIAVGAPFVGTNAGRVYLYDLNGSFIRTIIGDNSSGGKFGHEVELGGHTLLVGQPLANYLGTEKGRLWIINVHTGSTVHNTFRGSANYDQFARRGTLAVSGDLIIFGDPGYSSNGYTNNGALYIMRYSYDKDSTVEDYSIEHEFYGGWNNAQLGAHVTADNGLISYSVYDTDSGRWYVRVNEVIWFGNSDEDSTIDTYGTRHVAETLGDYIVNPTPDLIGHFYYVAGGSGGGGGGGSTGTDGFDGKNTTFFSFQGRYPGYRVARTVSGGFGGAGGANGSISIPTAGGKNLAYPTAYRASDADVQGGPTDTSSDQYENYPGDFNPFNRLNAQGGGGGGGVNDPGGLSGNAGAGGTAGGDVYNYGIFHAMDTLSAMQGKGGGGGTGGGTGSPLGDGPGDASDGGEGASGLVILYSNRPYNSDIFNTSGNLTQKEENWLYYTHDDYPTPQNHDRAYTVGHQTAFETIGSADVYIWFGGEVFPTNAYYQRTSDIVLTNLSPYNNW